MMDDDDGDVCAPQERITVPQDIPQLCSYFFLEPDFSTASARQLAAKAVTASTRTCRHAVLLFFGGVDVSDLTFDPPDWRWHQRT